MRAGVISICYMVATCITFARGSPEARNDVYGVGTIQNISPNVDCVVERDHIRIKASVFMRLLPGDEIVLIHPENGAVTVRTFGSFDHVLSVGHEDYRVPDGPGLAELMEVASQFLEQWGTHRAWSVEANEVHSYRLFAAAGSGS